MNRKAFTLIELLVVIAIIAILAAILFPVFAQAKVAAKKSVSISNAKQIGLAMVMYATDYDDLYPRNDDCQPGTALNKALNSNPFNPTGAGCTFPFYYRLNHFAWQKWIMPYIKNVPIFEHPLRDKDAAQWTTHGQIVGGFVLNSAVTGSLDTYLRAPTFLRQFRNSWVGGTVTRIPDPAQAIIIMEFPTANASVLPGGTVDPGEVSEIVYPPAIREFWRYKLMKGTVADCIAGTSGGEVDNAKVPGGGITTSATDGSARFIPAGRFLAQTPTKLEYLGVTGSHTAGWTFQNDCAIISTGNLGFVQPNTTINYPMWALGQ
ncbi:MAG: prepilin-type N-terminal cleavage/methylation domain-containing protein [Fimbriimonadaceae bacterium]